MPSSTSPAGLAPFDLTGQVAIVTGGASGIGEGIAKRFAGAGATVVVVDIAPDGAARVAEEVPGAHYLEADLADLAVPSELIGRIVAEHGGAHILVNNAAAYPNQPFLQTTPEHWDRVYALNLRGPALLSHAFAEGVVSRGGRGKIVFIASIDGIRPSLQSGLAAYGSLKGAIITLAAQLARELAPFGIGVNGIAPGAILTDGVRRSMARRGLDETKTLEYLEPIRQRAVVGRLGEPDDIAKAALFLASSASDFVCGQTIVVDGGWSLT